MQDATRRPLLAHTLSNHESRVVRQDRCNRCPAIAILLREADRKIDCRVCFCTSTYRTYRAARVAIYSRRRCHKDSQQCETDGNDYPFAVGDWVQQRWYLITAAGTQSVFQAMKEIS